MLLEMILQNYYMRSDIKKNEEIFKCKTLQGPFLQSLGKNGPEDSRNINLVILNREGHTKYYYYNLVCNHTKCFLQELGS